MPPKTFAEDENATRSSPASTVLTPIEEEKKEMEQTETIDGNNLAPNIEEIKER